MGPVYYECVRRIVVAYYVWLLCCNGTVSIEPSGRSTAYVLAVALLDDMLGGIKS
jgi:hypothetical protein